MPTSQQGTTTTLRSGDPVTNVARVILSGTARGQVVTTWEPLSFWGGVDPASGVVIDTRHPLHGVSITGKILLMPTTRGSCTGSGVLLDMMLSGKGPAALVFMDDEDVVTLGAMIAAEMFGTPLPVLRVPPDDFRRLSTAGEAVVGENAIEADGFRIPLAPLPVQALQLTPSDEAMMEGAHGEAAAQAMRIVCAMAIKQGAAQLIDVSQVHIDGCIYASPANLTFAERMASTGAKVLVPATTNAISVDHANWRSQGVPAAFGTPAARLADAYVRMGCAPSFTCSPYLLDTAPRAGDHVAWSESNAVIFANTVIGARTAKHPDFFDLCIALTGRAPMAGPYLDENRKARRIINVAWPDGADESVWPLLGYLAGRAAPDRIPLLRGLAEARPSRDDLKALCAAFGTTSAAPMLHIEGVTPEADGAAAPDADAVAITRRDLAATWSSLNGGAAEVDLVALGSPHASVDECRIIADAFGERRRHEGVAVILTVGKHVLSQARRDGVLERLQRSGVQVLPDLCWCSIVEPLFPPQTRTVMTNSGKYAHYGPGLSGRVVRFGALTDCMAAALDGYAPARLPDWLR